jgi:hypothetical protein
MKINLRGAAVAIKGRHEGSFSELRVMHRFLAPICGAALLSFSISSSAVAATKIGSVAAVVGTTNAAGPGGNRTLKKGGEVFEDDKITVKAGNVQIELVDGTRVVVGPDSSLVLDEFVLRKGNKAERVAFKALRGTYRFISGKSPKSAYLITTAHATIGIRGTGFDVWSRKRTGVVVLQGRVRLNGQSSGSVDIGSGCRMGAASATSAELLTGAEKNSSIRENLPFLLDQSALLPRFRLNVATCRLGPPDEDKGSPGEAPRPQQQRNNRQN